MPTPNSYVREITSEQVRELQAILEQQDWDFSEAPYAHWRARKEKVNVVAYQSGKLTVQGKGMKDFIQFILEPQILKEARFGYENVLAEEEQPEMFEPHAGIDESGKGDYFGPLIVATAYVERSTARRLLDAGVTDSKAIKSDKKIAELAKLIRAEVRGAYAFVILPPTTYNRLYGQFANLNRLLAWGHAKSLESLLEKVPACPRAISDQFGRKETVLRALQERGRRIVLEQRPKAEADIAVAAASILARDEFVRRLKNLGEPYGVTLPKGAGPKVLEVARQLADEGGLETLEKVAKLHFKTTQQILGNA